MTRLPTVLLTFAIAYTTPNMELAQSEDSMAAQPADIPAQRNLRMVGLRDAGQDPSVLSTLFRRGRRSGRYIATPPSETVSSKPDVTSAQSKVVWSFNAMAAQPAGIPILRDLHVSSHGTTRFAKGKTGIIALICPVADDLDGVRVRGIRLTYLDGDGRQGPSVVSAGLRRVRRSDGRDEASAMRNGICFCLFYGVKIWGRMEEIMPKLQNCLAKAFLSSRN